MRYCLWGHRRGFEQLKLAPKERYLSLFQMNLVAARVNHPWGTIYKVMTGEHFEKLGGTDDALRFHLGPGHWGISHEAVLTVPANVPLHRLYANGTMTFVVPA